MTRKEKAEHVDIHTTTWTHGGVRVQKQPAVVHVAHNSLNRPERDIHRLAMHRQHDAGQDLHPQLGKEWRQKRSTGGRLRGADNTTNEECIRPIMGATLNPSQCWIGRW